MIMRSKGKSEGVIEWDRKKLDQQRGPSKKEVSEYYEENKIIKELK